MQAFADLNETNPITRLSVAGIGLTMGLSMAEHECNKVVLVGRSERILDFCF